MKEILALIETSDMETKMKTYFSGSVCSDECFMQTLFMQTTYAGSQAGMLTYVDWSEGKRSPKTLTIDDKENLISSDKLFARKFDIKTDRDVLEIFRR